MAIFSKIFGHKVGFWPRKLQILMFYHKNSQKAENENGQ
jgi:hypothetical protein